MELIIAILLALGSIANADEFNSDWEADHQAEYNQAQEIIDTGAYYYDERTGGLVVEGITN